MAARALSSSSFASLSWRDLWSLCAYEGGRREGGRREEGGGREGGRREEGGGRREEGGGREGELQ